MNLNFSFQKLFNVFTAMLAFSVMFSACPNVTVKTSPQPAANDAEEDSSSSEIPVSDSVNREYALAENIEDGAILHCFCWSFNSIKENLQNIKDAGFSAIQTSPVSKCRAGWENTRTTRGKILTQTGDNWWYHYQPVEYIIGNYQLGTEDEFKAMCEEAHNLGIKVIVDAVMNHCTSEYDYISDNIKALSGSEDPLTALFHDMTQGSQWIDDRYNATQKHLDNLYEWNTQSDVVQEYLLDFLKECVADGADGFRFDAARHIELPDDDAYSSLGISFQSDFWPTILQNGAVFQYGEILQDYYDDTVESGYSDNTKSGTRIGAYQGQVFGNEENFRTTASHYGSRVRSAISNKNLSVEFIDDFLMPGGARESLTVTWVESHDNYFNDQSYETLTTEQDAILGYALIASRKNGTPLFFDRPKGATSSNPGGSQYIGNAGSDMYKDSQVRALNFFRNKMAGSSERLSNPGDSEKVLLVQRGAGGFVIINLLSSAYTLDSVSCELIADGTYADEVSGNTFTVSDGKLSGKVNASSVAVVFAIASGDDFTGTTVSIEKAAYPSWNNFYCYAYYDDGAVKNASWPGVKLTEEDSVYTYEIPESLGKECIVIFNNGSGGDGNQSAGYFISEGKQKILDSSLVWKHR